MVTKVPNADPGIAGFHDFGDHAGVELLTGDTPLSTTTENVGASTDLPIYSVVGRTGNAPGGNLVLADEAGAGSVKPVGILTAPVKTGVGESLTVDVYRSGMFNPAALNWHADYNTDALKKHAFEGSVSPNIFIQENKFDPTFT